MMGDHLSEGSKHMIDALSLATLLGSLANVLPSIAAMLTIFWTIIRIVETASFRHLLKKIFGIDYNP